MELLGLPDLVLRRLHSLMGFADLCRLRLTCKTLESLISGQFSKLCTLRLPIIEEDQSGAPSCSTGKFLEKLSYGLPVTELYIKNETENMYTPLQSFADCYGPGVKKLKLQNYFLDSPVQTKFLDALPNVEEIKIENIDAVGHKRGYYPKISGQSRGNIKIPNPTLQLPSFFKTLKVLKFGNIRVGAIVDTDFWYVMISSATSLTYIRYPRVTYVRPVRGGVNTELKYECIKDLIDLQRSLFLEEEGRWLRFIDFKNINVLKDIDYEGFAVLFLVDKIWPLRIKILNMHVAHLDSVSEAIEGDNRIPFNCITSMIDYRSNMSILPMDGLEKVVIRAFDCIGVRVPSGGWKNLKAIEVHFDGELMEEKIANLDIHANLASIQYMLFLMDGRADYVTELKIVFSVNFLIQIPTCVLSPKDVVRLSALTKLSLIGWNPANKVFSRLWRGLPLLEELVIKDCPSLGNVGFIGEDEKNPAFLQLKRDKGRYPFSPRWDFRKYD